VPSLGPEKRIVAARLFRIAATKRSNFAWTPQLVDLLSALPPAEVHPLFRLQWNNLSLRDDLLPRLATKPEPVDREKFLLGLSSSQRDVVIASAGALLDLPSNSAGPTILPIMRCLQRHLSDPGQQALRSLLITLLKHESGEAFAVQEANPQSAEIRRAYQPVFAWFRKKFPTLVRGLDSADGTDVASWISMLPSIPWSKGDAGRGETIFQNRGCQTCHASASPVGPDLAGITRRFSAADLLIAMVDPSRDIAAPYRSTTFRLRSGETYTGVVVFESADGVILQTSATTTVRLAESDIASRLPSEQSLMPAGLLTGLNRGDIADLYAYLSRLTPER
jgi:putative heme-binding domain-containing protein